MLFVALMKVRSGTEQERVARRLQWEVPEGISIQAQYWLHTPDPEVIIILEADNFAAMAQMTSEWNDFYDITIVPAITAEEGMELAKQMME